MADNDLSELTEQLALQLRDTLYATWGNAEVSDLVTWAAASLWPRYSREVLPTDASVTLVKDTFFYLLPAGLRAVSRVDLLYSDGTEYGPVHGRAWELTGDTRGLVGQIHISPSIVNGFATGSVRLVGYGAYDLQDYLPSAELVSIILARARAEAYRRVGADRERFKAWLVRNQNQNVSVNELMQLINEADNEIQRLERQTPRTWQKPVPGTR